MSDCFSTLFLLISSPFLSLSPLPLIPANITDSLFTWQLNKWSCPSVRTVNCSCLSLGLFTRSTYATCLWSFPFSVATPGHPQSNTFVYPNPFLTFLSHFFSLFLFFFSPKDFDSFSTPKNFLIFSFLLKIGKYALDFPRRGWTSERNRLPVCLCRRSADAVPMLCRRP